MQRRLEAEDPVLSPRHGHGQRQADLRNGARTEIAASPIRRWRALRQGGHRVLDQGAERHSDDEGRQRNLLDAMTARSNLSAPLSPDGVLMSREGQAAT